jgi:ATP-dependent DNA helicase PIF1
MQRRIEILMGIIKSIASNILTLFQSESKTQRTSIDYAKKSVDLPKVQPKQKVRSVRKPEDSSIDTTEYKTALSFLDSKFNTVFVTGQAGTGKSTFIRYLREIVGLNAPVLAPTGVAALNVNGQTIHSFFQIPPRIVDAGEIQPLRNRRLFEELRVLIIDEISMVRADLMDIIDISLRKNTGRSNELFGGVQLVLVGDLFQLPPVIATQIESQYIHSRYRTPYFLSSNCMKSARPGIVELTKVFRQQDATFIQLLLNIREGNELIQTISEFNRRCFIGNTGENGVIILTPDNQTAERINHTKLSMIQSKEYEYEGVVVGQFNIAADRLPAPKRLKLKVGAHVMFTKNDSTHRWVNGTLGIVKELSTRNIIVESNGMTFTVNKETWESLRYVYDESEGRIIPKTIGTYTQFPLMLAWAVTIHKSQGKTFEKVHIDISNGAFAEGQLYVALSRCKTIEGISLLKPIKVQDVKVNPTVKEFHEKIRNS